MSFGWVQAFIQAETLGIEQLMGQNLDFGSDIAVKL